MSSISLPSRKLTNEKIAPSHDLLNELERIRVNTLQSLDKTQQSSLGQFFTPPSVARFMASLFRPTSDISISLIDAGAGVGTLIAAFVEKFCTVSPSLKEIHVVAFEIDPLITSGLKRTLEACQNYCDLSGINLKYEIRQEDFVETSVNALRTQGTFFSQDLKFYSHAILNPPYRKIQSASKTRKSLDSIGLETTNLYTAFIWLITKQLASNAEMVAIVPRSFCNGTYFRSFRTDFLKTMSIQRVHVFESRKQAFKETDVLQENIILHAFKNAQNPSVTISSNQGPEDDALLLRVIPYAELVQPEDPESFIRIVPDHLGQQINAFMGKFPNNLKDLGIMVSTGRVVDFRVRELLSSELHPNAVPLIYAHNFSKGYVSWPVKKNHKPIALLATNQNDSLAIPSGIYVLVKRFSTKEEKRRISAAVYDPARIAADQVGFENHLNYFHKNYGFLSLELAKGLAAYLNSTLVDQYFRQFSGHTQVNASDLRNLHYPTLEQLISLGKRIGDEFPDQDQLDEWVMEDLLMDMVDSENAQIDPILAKRRIREALSILQAINLPRAQQNDRSALTLLALLNIKPNTPWQSAAEPLIGITEMMEYFRVNYGISYAPNTRETVRRFTVHQFLQTGLVIANPDKPSRPINSPKTRYQIEPGALALVRSFGSPNWPSLLQEYSRASTKIASLRLHERAMNLIPVNLPDGSQLLLSPGGQNELIKKVIEEFCARYTPGGKLIYIGDAGQKINDNELSYFESLGIKLDRHGKMPDVVVYLSEKKWLVLVEAVTSHGPINIKRHNELKSIFKENTIDLVFVTAFETRKAMLRYMAEIDWETDVWIAETPSHLIHFNGEKFLGPYDSTPPSK